MALSLLGAATDGRDLAGLLTALCEAMVGVGIPLTRAAVGARLLDPVLDAKLIIWRRGRGTVVDDTPRPATPGGEAWRRSPFLHLMETGEHRLRLRIGRGEGVAEFALLGEFAAEGATDYLALRMRLGADVTLGEGDDLFSSWISDAPDGFAEADLALVSELEPLVAFVFASAMNAAVARALLATYLGSDAAGRVLGGAIERGSGESIRAVIWYSDLQGFTRLADTLPPEATVELLNDYAEILVDAIEGHGGQVLKFMGDGILAIFRQEDACDACGAALRAWIDSRRLTAALGADRRARGLPATRPYLALHTGEVLYGNIGGRARLDYTVLGPAVNEAARIATLCRSLDQQVVISEAFADACDGAWRGRLVGLGRFALRGVTRPQMLYTLEPGEAEETPPP